MTLTKTTEAILSKNTLVFIVLKTEALPWNFDVNTKYFQIFVFDTKYQIFNYVKYYYKYSSNTKLLLSITQIIKIVYFIWLFI